MTTPATAQDAQTEREREYGQFVAAETIWINGGRAFNAGDPVPVSHVSNGVVNAAQVRKVKNIDKADSASEKG